MQWSRGRTSNKFARASSRPSFSSRDHYGKTETEERCFVYGTVSTHIGALRGHDLKGPVDLRKFTCASKATLKFRLTETASP